MRAVCRSNVLPLMVHLPRTEEFRQWGELAGHSLSLARSLRDTLEFEEVCKVKRYSVDLKKLLTCVKMSQSDPLYSVVVTKVQFCDASSCGTTAAERNFT